MLTSEQRVALITGGASGIGLGIARALIEDGCRVVLIGRDEGRLRRACEELGPASTWRRADVAQSHEVEAAISSAMADNGRLDLLINNAGFTQPVSLSMGPDDAERNWDLVLDANLKGAFLTAFAAAPHLTSPGGRVVNISSIAAQTGGSRAGALAYAASKAGIHGLTFALARELGPRRITVNAVAPGFVAETGFTGAWDRTRTDPIVAESPLGRAGTASDIAGAVRWLASLDAAFVTGQVIAVNGGWRIG